jgi:RNA polymerase sigma factor (sigma-70 family)
MHDVVSDENLMLQYKDGDAQAFETLYARYRQPLFRYLQHQCGNVAIAEELFQDIWLSLIRARQRYQVSASFKTFIYHMAHNRLIDYYRKQKHGVPVSYDEHDALLNLEGSADPVSAERQVQGEQQLARLIAAIAALPEAQREAFLLKENTGMSVEQIADVTGVNVETAKSRIRYALNKLRNSIEREDHD